MQAGYHVLPMEKYLADPCVVPSLSSSIAGIILRESACKAWFQHPRLNPNYVKHEAQQFDIGTAAHAMLLEGANVIEVCEFADWRTNAAKEKREAARAAGKIPLLTRHRDDVVAMVSAAEAFIEHSEIAEYWPDADPELVGIALETDIWLRCRFDKITKNRRFIFDYKSTTDASPEQFSRQIVRMGYHIQEAMYRRIVRDLGGVNPRFVFLAQNVEPPYECSLHGCDESLQEIADAEVERAIHLWRVCSKSKSWPSYSNRIHYAIPTNWMLQDHEMRSLSDLKAA